MIVEVDMENIERRQKKSEGDYVLNKIFVCVDSKDDNTFYGRVFHNAQNEVQTFLGVDQLLLRIENFLDIQNYPAASTESRYFRKQKDRAAATEEEATMNNKEKGEKATFVIQVQYRQNATWQGHVTWVEKDIEQPFKSALELIKLLDSSNSSTEES